MAKSGQWMQEVGQIGADKRVGGAMAHRNGRVRRSGKLRRRVVCTSKFASGTIQVRLCSSKGIVIQIRASPCEWAYSPFNCLTIYADSLRAAAAPGGSDLVRGVAALFPVQTPT